MGPVRIHLRPDRGAPARGGRRVLRHRHPRRLERGRARRDAPGAGRAAVVQAVVPLRHSSLVEWRRDDAGAAAGPATRPKPRLATPLQRGRAVAARQVGVPVVRGVGSGVPHHPARPRRSRLRQGPAPAAPARVVHASERPDPRLRVGLRRREPARPRVGRVARLQDRETSPGHRGPGVPGPRLPEAAVELHVVGESQGSEGKNVFQGGFLGLDNVGVFDRGAPLPTGGCIEQSDGTAWVGMFCLNMLAIALELAQDDPIYEDMASKFFEHFVYISYAMNNIAGEGVELYNREDGFFYDVLHLPDGRILSFRVRSMVGLIPLFAVATLEPDVESSLPKFHR